MKRTLFTMFLLVLFAAASPVWANGTYTSKDGMKYIVTNAAKNGQRQPMAIFLHGADSDANAALGRMGSVARSAGWLVVAPKSTGRAWVQGDNPKVIRVIEEVVAQYRVDRYRIHIAGFSSGASRALTIGFENPTWFASVASFSAGVGPVGRNIATEEGLKVPYFLCHGTADRINTIDRTKQTVESMRELGFDVTYEEIPNFDHSIHGPTLNKWFKWAQSHQKEFTPGNVEELNWVDGSDLAANNGIGFAYVYNSADDKNNDFCVTMEFDILPIKDLQKLLGQVNCIKVDLASQPEWMEKLGIKKSPSVIVFYQTEEGIEVVKEISRKIAPKSIVSALKKAAKAKDVDFD